MVVAGVAAWLLITKHDAANDTVTSAQKMTPSQVCSSDIIGKANAPLAASDQTALAPVVDEITALKDFDHDPNCVYIVLQYSLASGNATQSSDYLNKLNRVYDPVTGYSHAFSVNIIPISSLQESVDFLVQNAKDSQTPAKQDDESTAAGSQAADEFHEAHN
jgi:hypothetical protein